MTVAARLRGASRGSNFGPVGLPTNWDVQRLAGNPVIDVDNNPNETTEQYVPAPILLPNGHVWVYVKGSGAPGHEIYAWRSTDAGVTFSLQNGGSPILSCVPSTWESNFVIEPAAVYDPVADVVHLYYKGRAGAGTWAWGHATAPGSTPTTFTKDPANPILTSAQLVAALGGSVGDDLAISDVVKIGDTFHFYGYVLHSGVYKLLHASGSSWNNPSGLSILLAATTPGVNVVEVPTVFRAPGGASYLMLYALGNFGGSSASIRAAHSADAVNWTFAGGDVMAPVPATWESLWTYACHVLKDGVGPFPVIDAQGRWRLYFSGYDGGDANCGLAYLTPTWG